MLGCALSGGASPEAKSTLAACQAFNADGSMSKRLHSGLTAQNGNTVTYQASEGFTGLRFVLEADWGGYFARFVSNHDYGLTTVFADLGCTSIKHFFCCRGCHSAIDVMHQMRGDDGVTAERVSEVQVSYSLPQHRQLGNPAPTTVAEAHLSMPFAIAAAKGDPRNPVPTAQVVKKFQQLIAERLPLDLQAGCVDYLWVVTR